MLGALTCGTYLLYWAFKTWRDLKQQAELVEDNEALSVFRNTNPALRTIGFLVPVVQIYLLAVLCLGLANLDPDESARSKQHPYIACGVVVGAIFMCLTFARLPGLWYLLSLLCAAPFAFPQHWLNRYWQSVEDPNLPVRHAFNVWEMVAIIVGSTLIGLDIAGLMIGVPQH